MDSLDPICLREAISDARLHFETTLTRSNALDQKASTLTSVFLAIATGIVGALAALQSGGKVPTELAVSAFFTVGLFVIAAIYCVSASFPGNVWLPSHPPKAWLTAMEHGYSLEEIFREKLSQFDKFLDDNEIHIRKKALRYTFGAYIGIFAPVAGTIFYVQLRLFPF